MRSRMAVTIPACLWLFRSHGRSDYPSKASSTTNFPIRIERDKKRQSPHKAGFGIRVGGRCWSPAYKVYQDSHRTVLCSSASHGIRAGSQRGDLSNRVPFGTRPTCPCHPFAHQSASSPTCSIVAYRQPCGTVFLDRFDPLRSPAGSKENNPPEAAIPAYLRNLATVFLQRAAI